MHFSIIKLSPKKPLLVIASSIILSISIYNSFSSAQEHTSTDSHSRKEIERLRNLCQESFKKKKIKVALHFCQNTHKELQTINNSFLKAKELVELGIVYASANQNIKALDVFQSSLELAIKARDGALIAVSQQYLSTVFKAQGQLEKASILRSQSELFFSNVNVANQHIQQGIDMHNTSQFKEAIKSWEAALKIFQKINNRDGKADTLDKLGNTYYSWGQYSTAIEFHLRALAIARKTHNHFGESAFLSNIANSYNSLGQYKKALNSLQHALTIARAINNRKLELFILGNLGNTYDLLHQYNKAIGFYQKSLDISKDLGFKKEESISLNNIGKTKIALGQYSIAIIFLQQSLEIERSHNDIKRKLDILNNLGIAYQGLGHNQKALHFLMRSFELSIKIGDPAGLVNSLNNLGNAFSDLGKHQQAIEFLKQSLEISDNIGYEKGKAICLLNLGAAYNFLGQYQRAIRSFHQSLVISYDIKAEGLTALSLRNIGRILEKLKDSELSITFLKQSINTFETIRSDNRTLPKNLQISYTHTIEDAYRQLADLLLRKDRILEALHVLDLLKVQELQDFFKDVEGNELTAKGIQLFQGEQQILAPLKSKNIPNLNTYLNSESVRSLSTRLRKTAAFRNKDLDIYTNLNVRLKALGKRSALFYPLLLDDRLELVFFTPNHLPIRRSVSVSKKQIEQSIKEFRASLQDPNNPTAKTYAQTFYKWLLKPLENDLKKANIQTLFYAPDGLLRYVPLAALYDGKQWAIEKYKINYLTAFGLTKTTHRPIKNPRIMAAAYTHLDTTTINVNGQEFNFPPIPAALPEVKRLAESFPKTQLFLKEEFTHSAMNTSHLNQYDIVHLATHGKLINGSPSNSFILLNNGNYVTLRDIKDWEIPNLALVVLSACETALGGKLGNGIEIIGFGYQLQVAQARASISTLWSINDVTTSNLMDAFYKHLKQDNLNPVDALQQAQIDLITNGDGTSNDKDRSSVVWPPETGKTNQLIRQDLTHPYYWAPFILIGNGL